MWICATWQSVLDLGGTEASWWCFLLMSAGDLRSFWSAGVTVVSPEGVRSLVDVCTLFWIHCFFHSTLHHHAGCCSCARSTFKCWTNWKRRRLTLLQSVGYAITVSKAASTETACQHNAARYINFRSQLFPAAHLSRRRSQRAVDSSFASVTVSAAMQRSLLSASWLLGRPLTPSLSTLSIRWTVAYSKVRSECTIVHARPLIILLWTIPTRFQSICF